MVINVAPGESLEMLFLHVGGAVVYDWRSDTGNPPVGNFAPTIPAQDLGARCGQTYTLGVSGRDSGDPPDTV
jgi:hypothetical protein